VAIHSLAVTNEIPFDRRILSGELPDMLVVLHDAEIDPSAYVGSYVVVCRGLEKPTRIGARSIIEAGTVVGHDAQIEEDVEIASNSGIGGYAIIRKGAKIGMGVSVVPYVCIGEGARVGAGAVVTKHIMAGEIVAGVPAAPLRPWDKNRLKCGCTRDTVWDGCPHHGSDPVC
jgi:UDP-3-O-[3-hydroxymyristoyl] glucosamine N-acyltransferase